MLPYCSRNTWQPTRCSLTFDQRFIWLLTRCSLTFDPRFTWCYPIAPDHMTIYPLFTNFWSTVSIWAIDAFVHWLLIHGLLDATLFLPEHMATYPLFTDFDPRFTWCYPIVSRTHGYLPVVHWLLIHGLLDVTLLLSEYMVFITSLNRMHQHFYTD